MTDKKDGPAAGSDRASTESAGKRPFATIDLKATEVRAAGNSGASAASSAGASTARTTGGSSQTETAAKVAAAARAAQTGPAAAAGTASTKAEPSLDAGGKSATQPAGLADTASAKAGSARAATGTAAAPKAHGGIVSHMGAGIAGGLLAMLGLPFVAPLVGLDPVTPAPTVVSGIAPDYVARLSVLEKQVRERLATPAVAPDAAARLSADTARLDDLTRQLGALAEAQGKLQSENAAMRDELAKQASLKDAGDRLVRMEEQLNGMVAAATADPQKAGRLPQLAQLTAQVADLKSALETRLAAQRKDMALEIEARVATAAEAAEAAKAGAKRLDGEVAAVRSEASRLGQRADQLKSGTDRLDQSLKAVQDEQAAFKTTLESYKTDVDGQLKSTARPNDVAMALAPVAAKVASLEASVQSVIKAEEDRKSNAERIVLSLELGNLKRAMDRGQKFANELDEVKKNAGGKLNLAALEKFQNQGVPTIVDLSKTFRPLANSILDAEAEPSGGSMVDRLLTSAKTVVRVRKTSYSPDDTSSEATVARMETALKESRLADVLSEAKKLPAKALVPAREWLAQVEARNAVEAELATIDLALKSSLGAGPGSAAQKGGK